MPKKPSPSPSASPTKRQSRPEGKCLKDRLRGLSQSAVPIGAAGYQSKSKLDTATMADVAELVRGIEWLVPQWIPHGLLSVMIAEPGVGKSALALGGLTAPIVTGGRFFGRRTLRAPKAHCLWADTEGSAAITTQRVKDWGLPADRIMVPFANDPLNSLSLEDQSHLKRIERLINDYQIPLVVVDSLRGAQTGDENSSAIANVLGNLAAIAERTRAAIVVIHHSRKLNEDESLSANSSRGSNGIAAMARVMIGIDKPDPNSEWCRVRMVKNNIGLSPDPFGFEVTGSGVKFGEAPQPPRKGSGKTSAKEWLRNRLKSGKWASAKKIQDEAKAAGISTRVLQTARESLGVTKPDFVRQTSSGWQWRRPGT